MYIKFFKRFLDIVASFFALIIFAPIFVILALLVRIKLGRGVIFKQLRPGYQGQLFVMYKFRTMLNKTDERGKILPDDKRLTNFGKILRASSLDELPELINILKGDMSFIGPRPQLAKDMVFFDDKIMKRQSVKPGLSGLAQVNGRNNISWDDKFKFDLEYINNISFFKDVSIVWDSLIKAFIKHDDINSSGLATSEDYGDYLLRLGRIDDNFYNLKMKEATKLINDFKKCVK